MVTAVAVAAWFSDGRKVHRPVYRFDFCFAMYCGHLIARRAAVRVVCCCSPRADSISLLIGNIYLWCLVRTCGDSFLIPVSSVVYWLLVCVCEVLVGWIGSTGRLTEKGIPCQKTVILLGLLGFELISTVNWWRKHHRYIVLWLF